MNIKKELTLQDFIEMEKLEKQFYSEDFITPAQESYACYIQDKWSIVAVEVENKIVGFMNLFPIKSEVFNKIKSGMFNDKDLVAKDISDIDKTPYLFLSCVVVHQAYRKKGVLNLLFQTYMEYYKDAHMKQVIMDVVTVDGERVATNLGFTFITETSHHSKVYLMSFQDLFLRIRAI